MMKNLLKRIGFGCLFLLMPMCLMAQVFNVQDYGASANKKLSTRAIQRAIDDAAKQGGGKVVFPPGNYLSSALFLRDNITIEIQSGATVYFHDDIADTPVVDGAWEGICRKVYASLFTGFDLENVTITGRGRIDGQGTKWWKASDETNALRRKLGICEREPENPIGSPLEFPRPRVINLYRCSNVKISDIYITNSPSWTVHPMFCKNVSIDGITIYQPYGSPNTDGIDPESCNGVRISNCYVDCGDDCIAIKSGYNEHGRKMAKPCENISIMNCTFVHGRSAVGIGSEMSGGVRNVTVMNCVFDGTLRGLRVKTGRGRGGVVENLLASGIIMQHIEEGISIDMSYGDGELDRVVPVTEETPYFKNIRYSNIVGTDVDQAVVLKGLREAPAQHIVLENMKFEGRAGMEVRYAKDLTLRNLELYTTDKLRTYSLENIEGAVLDNLKGNLNVSHYPMMDLIHSNDVLIQNFVMPVQSNGWLMHQTGCGSVRYLHNLLESCRISK